MQSKRLIVTDAQMCAKGSAATNGDKRATLGSKEIAVEEEEKEEEGRGRGGCHVVVTAYARCSLEIDTADWEMWLGYTLLLIIQLKNV